jgi:hypothetical protein
MMGDLQATGAVLEVCASVCAPFAD